jgi:hypothetical protein
MQPPVVARSLQSSAPALARDKTELLVGRSASQKQKSADFWAIVG